MTKNLSRSAAEVIARTIVRSGAEHRGGKGLTPSAREAAIARAIEPVIAEAVRQASSEAELEAAKKAFANSEIGAASLRVRAVRAEQAKERYRLRLDACEFAMVLMQGQIRKSEQEREQRQLSNAFGGDSVAIAG